MKLFTRKQALPDCEWRPDGIGLSDLGAMWAIGYVRPDRPKAIVLVSFAAAEYPQGSGSYAVERLTEYIVGDGGRPALPVAGTWMDRACDYLGGSVPNFRYMVLLAQHYARETFANGYPIDWDGVPGWGEA